VLSRLGIIERYARQVEVAGVGRWTTAASHDGDYSGTVEVLRLAQASSAVGRISLLTRDGLVHDDHRGPDGKWTTGTTAVQVLAEARDTGLSRLQRKALANHLTSTLERLQRANLAHPALQDMAAEVARDLARFPADLHRAWDQSPERTTALDEAAVPIVHVDPDNMRLAEPGVGLDLEL
jgi:hypothetical protein